MTVWLCDNQFVSDPLFVELSGGGRKRGGENRGGRFSGGADSRGEGQTGGEMEYKGISTLKD